MRLWPPRIDIYLYTIAELIIANCSRLAKIAELIFVNCSTLAKIAELIFASFFWEFLLILVSLKVRILLYIYILNLQVVKDQK